MVFSPACLLDTAVTEARACKSHPACSLHLEKEAHEDGQEFIQGVHLGIAFAGAGLDLFLHWNTLQHVLSKGARGREAFGLQALIVLRKKRNVFCS